MKKFLKIAILILATFTTPVYADVIAPDWLYVEDDSESVNRYLVDRNSVVEQDNGLIVGVFRQDKLAGNARSAYELVRIDGRDCAKDTKSGTIVLAEIDVKDENVSALSGPNLARVGAPKYLFWSEEGRKIFDDFGSLLCSWKKVKDKRAQDGAIDSDKSYWGVHPQ